MRLRRIGISITHPEYTAGFSKKTEKFSQIPFWGAEIAGPSLSFIIKKPAFAYTISIGRYELMAGFLIALLSGALMSVQGVFNTQVTKTTGIWVSNGWVQLSAFLLCLLVWLATGRDSVAALMEVQPRYMLLGGVIGAGITWTVIKSVDALGPARSALLIVVSQLAVAYLISLSGMFGMEKEPFSWRKLVGLLIAAGGIVLFQWK